MSLKAIDDERERLADLVTAVRICYEGRNRLAAAWAARGPFWQSVAAAPDAAALAALLPAFAPAARTRYRDACVPLVAILGPLFANADSLPANDLPAGT